MPLVYALYLSILYIIFYAMQYIPNFPFRLFGNIEQFINMIFIFFNKILKEVFITSLRWYYHTTIAKSHLYNFARGEKRGWFLDNMRFCSSLAFRLHRTDDRNCLHDEQERFDSGRGLSDGRPKRRPDPSDLYGSGNGGRHGHFGRCYGKRLPQRLARRSLSAR